MDISKHELYITLLRRVLHHRITQREILHTEGREFDGLILVLNGKCHYHFDDGTECLAEAGKLLYLACGSRYRMELFTPEYEVIFVDFLFDSNKKRNSALFSLTVPEQTEQFFRRLYYRFGAQDVGYLGECMALLYHIHASILVDACREYQSPSTRALLEKAQQFILDNLQDESLSVADLAAHTGVSEVYLRRLFAKRFHTAPSAYITDLRLGRAKELMRLPYLTLEEISLQCGFSTPSYFSRVFKACYGTTPGCMRKELLKNN